MRLMRTSVKPALVNHCETPGQGEGDWGAQACAIITEHANRIPGSWFAWMLSGFTCAHVSLTCQPVSCDIAVIMRLPSSLFRFWTRG